MLCTPPAYWWGVPWHHYYFHAQGKGRCPWGLTGPATGGVHTMTSSANTSQSEPCAKCGAGGAQCTVLVDGTRKGRRETWCTACWNAQARRQRDEHAEALARRPRCAVCGTRPVTWYVGAEQVGMCGYCRRKAQRGA